MHQIVVIGGGPAGVEVTKSLSKLLRSTPNVKITLIEKRDRFFHSIGALRAMVDTSFIPKILIPYDHLFTNVAGGGGAHVPVEFKAATVQQIDYKARTVTYQPKHKNVGDHSNTDHVPSETITYDYLILATGSSYPSPIKPEQDGYKDITEDLIQTAKKIQDAKRILVIGGGAVGIEMVGEINAFYPDKEIMLLDANTELLSNQKVPKLRPIIKEALLKKGVKLYLGHRLKERLTHHQFGTKTFTTDKGLVIESDAQIVCVGMKPNIDLMTDPECIENDRFIKVKDTMEIDCPSTSADEIYKNVFVLGDASNHPTPKLAYWAGEQGKHLAKCLAANIQSGTAFQPYQAPSTEALFLPLGPKGGAGQLPMGKDGVIVGNFLTRMLKSKDLFTGMFWKNMNAKMPK